jgi:hypothetical protein
LAILAQPAAASLSCVFVSKPSASWRSVQLARGLARKVVELRPRLMAGGYEKSLLAQA